MVIYKIMLLYVFEINLNSRILGDLLIKLFKCKLDFNLVVFKCSF